MNETLRLILIVAVISIVVSIVANIEMFITKKRAIYHGKLMKNFTLIKPEETGLNGPVFIFNTKNVKAKDIPQAQRLKKEMFLKYPVEEHLASRLNRPVREFVETLKNIPKTKTPFNMLFNAVIKGEIIASATDPAATMSPTNYKIMHAKDDDIEIFISNDEYYILQK